MILDPAEVAHAAFAGAEDPNDDQVFILLKSGGTWTAVGPDVRGLWAALTTPTSENVGDGVLIRRPKTAPALVIYAENTASILCEWDEKSSHTNVFILGADPKKTWVLVADGKSVPFHPTSVGYGQTTVPPGPRHRLSLGVF